jgi:hypothetical protein
VLYSGLHDGVFGFYVRARDPYFERRLQLANKLLARYELTPQFLWMETPYVESPDEVVELIRRTCGCRWIVVEAAADNSLTTADRFLREAVKGPEFEHVRSFQVRAYGVARVDLFRFLLPLDPPPPIDLVFPSFSARVFPGVEPIRSRR